MAKKTAAPKDLSKRKFTRFSPDPGTYAKLDLSSGKDFKPTHIALVAEEAYGGCGLVLLNDAALEKKLKPKDKIKVQVGLLEPMRAEIRWRVDLDSKVVRLGILYVE